MFNKLISQGTPSLPSLPLQQHQTIGEAGVPTLRSLLGDRCENLRHSPDGVESLAEAAPLATTGNIPVFADTRLGTTYIFTLDTAGALRMEIGIDPAGTVTRRSAVLGHIAPGECRCARVGEFLVVSDADGAIHYLKWNRRTSLYTWLDRLPDIPDFSVEAVEAAPREGTVPAVTFGNPVGDLRGGVPDEMARQVADAVETTLLRLRDDCGREGYWTGPLLVRFAVRMWDDTLLYLSTPVAVAPSSFIPWRRTSLPLLLADGSFTGTSATAVAMPRFRLRVSADAAAMGRWSDIASYIEIWVSRQPDVTADGDPSVSYTAQGVNHRLWVTPPLATEEEMTRRLFESGYERVAEIPCADGAATVDVSRPADVNTDLLPADVTTPRATVVTRATAIAGHGGFLHLGGYTRELPRPTLPKGEPGATTTARATVTVRLNSLRGAMYAVAEGDVTADNALIMPPLWYPDSSAASIRIAMQYADGRLFEREWEMKPAPGGENGAFVLPDSMEPMSLYPVLSLTPVPEGDAVGEYVDETLTTMRRGNPFVVGDTTRYAGGHITAIHAQQSGGGAYTRQYLYLFSDTGIVAVTHDMTGRHTNCRPVSMQTVGSPSRIAASDSGVWALTDSGTLLRLRDASVTAVLRGLLPQFRLGVSSTPAELWLAPDGNSDVTRSVVIDTDSVLGGDVKGYLSTYRPFCMLQSGGRMFTAVTRGVGASRYREIGEIAIARRGMARMEAEWVSPPLDGGNGGLTRVETWVIGEDIDATLEIHALAPWENVERVDLGEGTLLASATLRGSGDEGIELPLILPRPGRYPKLSRNRLLIRVKGRFEAVTGYSIINY